MDSELKQLRKELTLLENDLGVRVKSLEQRISVLENQQLWQTDTSQTETARVLISEPNKPDSSITDVVPASSVSARHSLYSQTLSGDDDKTAAMTKEGVEADVQQKAAELSAQQKAEIAFAKTLIKTESTPAVTKSVTEASGLKLSRHLEPLLSLFASNLLGPFAALFSQFFSTYHHYKKQGKAPVFFMTLAGIVALVLSFAYLLQYSFNEFLGPTGKVLSGFTVAIAITVAGIFFTKRQHQMAEYGSGIIGLGVVLNYLCAYFAGPYYDLLPPLLGFGLLSAVTIIAFVIALYFETRVVAMVTLLGGAFMPLIMQHIDDSPLLYLAYLWVLAMAMLQLSHRIRWPALAMVSMIVSAAMIEYSLLNRWTTETTDLLLIALMHAFFYGFAFYILRGLKNDTVMEKSRLYLTTATLMFFLIVIQQVAVSSMQAGVIYAANIVPWLLLFLWPNKLFNHGQVSDAARSLQVIALLYAGVFSAFAVLLLTSPALSGATWAAEGLLLLYLGGRYAFTSVRVEGYIALAIALISMVGQAMLWLADGMVSAPEILQLEFNGEWLNLLGVPVCLAAMLMIVSRFTTQVKGWEQLLKTVSDNAFAIAASLTFLLTVSIFSSQLMWLLAVIPMFAVIYYAQHRGLFVAELVGLAHLALIIFPVLLSAAIVGNFHYSEQNIFAQIARVEAFVCLWLIAEFYRRYCQQSRLFAHSENLRKLFYLLIPVFFLPTVWRKYPELFPVVLWLSSAISLFLYHRLQYGVLKLELRVLVLAASIAAIFACGLQKFAHWQGYASPALLLGVAAFIFLLFYGKGLQRNNTGNEQLLARYDALKPLHTWGIFYHGIAVFILLYGISSQLALGLLASSLYFTGVYFYRPVLAPIRRQLWLIYAIIFVLFIVLSLLHMFETINHRSLQLTIIIYNAAALASVLMLVYRDVAQNRWVWRVTARQLVHLWLFHISCIIAYGALIMQLFTTMQGPVFSFSLVLHATLLLFQSVNPKMKKLIWLSLSLFTVAGLKVLLWDLQDFSLIQKIVVFMLIGASMLAAAFKYQRMLPQQQEHA